MSLPRALAAVTSLVLAVTPVLAVAQWTEPAIADNSFLVEEAYNQETGVVQHISALTAAGQRRQDLSYSFTQEWPFRGQRHQLSYTVPVTRPGGQSAGLGDILLNYRYQLGGGGVRWAVAPRLTLILPTGSVSRGLGDGTVAVQVNLPLSYRLTRALVTHWNAGATYLPWAEGPAAAGGRLQRSLTSFNLAGSVIAPTSLPVQLVFESVANFDQEIGSTGRVSRTTTWTFSPGARVAINLNELQIVPGLAFPFIRSAGVTSHGLFFYLSFEHPFSQARATSEERQ